MWMTVLTPFACGDDNASSTDASDTRDAAPSPRPKDAADAVEPSRVTTPDSGTAALSSYALVPRTHIAATAHSLAIGDVTSDGRADLVIADGAVKLFEQTDAGALRAGRTLLEGGARNAQLLDLDHDGRLDVLTSGDAGLSALLARGAGEFAAPRATEASSVEAMYGCDFDRDDRLDVIGLFAERDAAGGLAAFAGDGRGAFTARPLRIESSEAGPIGGIAVGDVTSDTNADLIVFRHDMQGSIEVYAHDGVSTFADRPSARHVIGNASTSLAHLALGDLDGDGRTDVLLSAEQGLPGIAVLGQTADGTLERRGAVATNSGVGPVVVRDMDGDGDNDVVAVVPKASEVRVYVRSAGAYRELTRARIVGASSLTDVLAVGDLDADGCNDVAVADDEEIVVLYGRQC